MANLQPQPGGRERSVRLQISQEWAAPEEFFAISALRSK